MRYYIFHIIGYILIVALILFIGKLFYEAVVGSSMPDWLKYIILR